MIFLPALLPARPSPLRVRQVTTDVLVAVGFVLSAVVLYAGLWRDLDSAYLYYSGSDQQLWEWFFSVTAKAVTEGNNPLFTDLLNHPLGVNLMANTSMLGVGIPLAPLTIAFGPTVTWTFSLTAGLAGTAFAWYWLFSRHVVRWRPAAIIGAGFCGLAPAIVSHATAHPNFAVGFVLPLLLTKIIRIAAGTRPVRDGVLLGLLAAYQIFLGEESLLIFAMTLLVFGVAYLLAHPNPARLLRPLAVGLGTGAVVALAIVAVPLWWQFFGPQSYHSLEHGPTGNDLLAFTRYASQSVAGDPGSAGAVAMNRTEENAFFGWPLIILVVVILWWLRRDALARALGVAAFVLAWLSTGVELVIANEPTGIPGPWVVLTELPLLDTIIESRLALGCVPAIGALLALAADRIDATTIRSGPTRLWWLGSLVAALLPLVPLPLETYDRPSTPRFFTEDTWKSYVDPGGSVVPVPLASPGNAEPMRWQVVAGLDFPIPEGYFLGPNAPDDRRGRYGATHTPTSQLLETVATEGEQPSIGEPERAAARHDLRYWRADLIVLAPRQHDQALRATLAALLDQQGVLVGDVWIWDVRHLTR
ncbi:glycosyl transferase [Actinophytocola sediminis]